MKGMKTAMNNLEGKLSQFKILIQDAIFEGAAEERAHILKEVQFMLREHCANKAEERAWKAVESLLILRTKAKENRHAAR